MACDMNSVILRLKHKLFNPPVNVDLKEHVITVLQAEINAIEDSQTNCNFDGFWCEPENTTVARVYTRLVQEMLHNHQHFIGILSAALEAIADSSVHASASSSRDDSRQSRDNGDW